MSSFTPHAELMDRVYRVQRHFYDLTRRYFLFGRDTLIRSLQLAPGEHILEVGVGTARNLVKIGEVYPAVQLYGLDASEEMLKTASCKVQRAGIGERTKLAHCLAEALDHRKTFGVDRPFDVVVFSYSLSMIPSWREALERALENLKPGGSIYIVDFWDQHSYPRWFRRLLKSWLRLFHVEFRPELLQFLGECKRRGAIDLRLESIGASYAYLAQVEKSQSA